MSRAQRLLAIQLDLFSITQMTRSDLRTRAGFGLQHHEDATSPENLRLHHPPLRNQCSFQFLHQPKRDWCKYRTSISISFENVYHISKRVWRFLIAHTSVRVVLVGLDHTALENLFAQSFFLGVITLLVARLFGQMNIINYAVTIGHHSNELTV